MSEIMFCLSGSVRFLCYVRFFSCFVYYVCSPVLLCLDWFFKPSHDFTCLRCLYSFMSEVCLICSTVAHYSLYY
jgi:hypothetical protein